MRRTLFGIGFVLATLLASAQEPKKAAAPGPPKLLYAVPLAVEAGKVAKLKFRGSEIEGATRAQSAQPSVVVKLIAKSGKKSGLSEKQGSARLGNSEIEVELTAPAELAAGSAEVTVSTPAGESSPGRVRVFDSAPVASKEPNNAYAQAQKLAGPCAVTGLIDAANDVDVYEFEAKKGEVWTAEAVAGRLGSPCDPILHFADAEGRLLAQDDDSAGLTDPKVEVKIPADGVYRVSLADANDQGSATHAYVLVLRKK